MCLHPPPPACSFPTTHSISQFIMKAFDDSPKFPIIISPGSQSALCSDAGRPEKSVKIESIGRMEPSEIMISGGEPLAQRFMTKRKIYRENKRKAEMRGGGKSNQQNEEVLESSPATALSCVN